jgi:hypothetical protein
LAKKGCLKPLGQASRHPAQRHEFISFFIHNDAWLRVISGEPSKQFSARSRWSRVRATA